MSRLTHNIKPSHGQIWKNDVGYELQILAVGTDELWCKWMNGNIGSFKKSTFLKAYLFYKDVK